ncbi:MAG: hypothetical protein KAI39_08740 [Desulfobulbaceae bacterium]|nr:hypothetical protein [Desulfobulbaceae bacterium]
MKRFIFILVFLLIPYAINAYGEEIGEYRGIPWNSRFPEIEKKFPGVNFVEEDSWHVTLFSLKLIKEGLNRIEFKLFEEQLISVLHYYDGPISQMQNDDFVKSMVSRLGPKIEERKTTSQGLAGISDVVIWEYTDNLILFKSYPPSKKEGFAKKENAIIFIYKPTFDKMVYHRKTSLGDNDNQVVDYDYIEF